jgi:two-component system, LuxR family, sensor kinase FixL
MLRSLRAWCVRRLDALLTAALAVCTALLCNEYPSSPALAVLPCLLLGWALTSLHRRASEAAQAALEQTLRTLRQSEAQLLSLLESTDDLVASLDLEGRLLTTNAALKHFHSRLFGHLPQPGDTLFSGLPPEQQVFWRQRLAQAHGGERTRTEVSYEMGGGPMTLEFTLNPVVEEGRVVRVTLFGRDITARKQAETRLAEMHRSLIDVSRQAGMAEIATGVLHNVGNTLNSINVSAGVVGERLRSSRILGLAKAAELLKANADRLPAFLTQEARGQQLPVYLVAVTDHLVREREALLREVQALAESIEHIKAIVSMQQEHAKPTGLVERLPVAQLIDDALRLHAVSFERLGIQVHREYEPMGLVEVDRHRLLQVLLNLLSNARHALLESGRRDRHITIRVGQAEGQRLQIEVGDNGVGIAPENLARLFTQGFTTKRGGHGFGLHISALAAQEMGGRLTARSEGLSQGATFTIELPPRGTEATP